MGSAFSIEKNNWTRWGSPCYNKGSDPGRAKIATRAPLGRFYATSRGAVNRFFSLFWHKLMPKKSLTFEIGTNLAWRPSLQFSCQLEMSRCKSRQPTNGRMQFSCQLEMSRGKSRQPTNGRKQGPCQLRAQPTNGQTRMILIYQKIVAFSNYFALRAKVQSQ
jgi:hypothetical protein